MEADRKPGGKNAKRSRKKNFLRKNKQALK